MITQEELKNLFNYNLETGVFTRKIATGRYNRFPIGSIAGAKHSQGYLVIVINGKTYRNHRLAWLYVYGIFPKEIDHINGIKDDNRINNLRECNRSQNVMNYQVKNNNELGIKGLYRDKQRKRFITTVSIGNTRLNATFSDSKYSSQEQAKKAAIKWLQETRERLHGEFCNHG